MASFRFPLPMDSGSGEVVTKKKTRRGNRKRSYFGAISSELGGYKPPFHPGQQSSNGTAGFPFSTGQAQQPRVGGDETLNRAMDEIHKNEDESLDKMADTNSINGGEMNSSFQALKKRRRRKQWTPLAAETWIAVVDLERKVNLFTFDQQQKLAEILTTAIIQAITEGVDGLPRMQGIDDDGGRFVIRCADQWTSDWLLRTVPTWTMEGMKLDAILASELPKLSKCSVFIPHLPGTSEISNSLVFKLLDGQNQGIDTSKWGVHSATKADKRMLFQLGVDSESMKVLESLEFQPFYGFDRVTFKPEKYWVQDDDKDQKKDADITDDSIQQSQIGGDVAMNQA